MTQDTIHKIYELLKAYVLPNVQYDKDLMNVLSDIWNVYQQNATGEDYRYKILGDEIEKHYVLNNDWSDDKLFVGLLKIFDDEVKLIRFTERLINMVEGVEGFDRIKNKLTAVLDEDGLELVLEQNVYRIGEKGALRRVPIGAKQFFVCESNITNTVQFKETEVKWPEEDDCFVLTHNYLWNDYSYYTRYRLYYVKDGKTNVIGEVKIMKRGAMNTSEHLPKQFVALEDDYCSLGGFY